MIKDFYMMWFAVILFFTFVTVALEFCKFIWKLISGKKL